jgi:hypothetical protein
VERISTNYDTKCHKANVPRHDKMISHSSSLLDLKLHFLRPLKLWPENAAHSDVLLIPFYSKKIEVL